MILAARSLLLSSHCFYAAALLLGGPITGEPGAENPLLDALPRPYNVLVFGDSWATIGPTWTMIRDLLAQHSVNAKVASVAVAGTTSCQWATNRYNLVWAGRKYFNTQPVDFVWFTLGGNDLLLPKYVTCSHRAETNYEARECLLAIAEQSVECNLQLLDTFWTVYPKAKVIQDAYDYECAGPKCMPSKRFPFCKSDILCVNTMATYWGHQLLDGLNASWNDDRYFALRLDGACQVAGNFPGAEIGDPNMSMGSPCSMMVGCEHPAPSSKASFLIGEGFWSKYFKYRMKPTEGQIDSKFVEVSEPNPLWREMSNLTEINFECNRHWIPNLEGPDPLNPPCNIGVKSDFED